MSAVRGIGGTDDIGGRIQSKKHGGAVKQFKLIETGEEIRGTDALVVNKIDFLDITDFCRTGTGIACWADWLENHYHIYRNTY